jgi:hypothetical protein
MPGITIKNELKLFRIKLDALVNKIEENFFRIEMKNTIWGIHDLMILQISYVDEVIEELEETENVSITQKERATTLLWPSQKLIEFEQSLEIFLEGSSSI